MSKESNSISQVRIIYIVTTIFLAALSIFTFLQVKTIFNSYTLISHARIVESNLLSIVASLVEAEKSVQGFLITGDSIMLRNCDEALLVLEKRQQVLDSLLSDDQAQVTNLAGLKVAIANKITSIHRILHESTPLQLKASARVNYDEGIQKMDSVNVYISRMKVAESGILLFRTEKVDRLSLVAPIYIIVIFLGALLILFFSYFRISAELRQTREMHQKSISQHKEKGLLSEELVIANQELAFQNEEKEKRAAELIVANTELAFQNKEKEKRAAELTIANKELAFQNEEKEKRAAELIVANRELAFQNEEKEKRAAELMIANKELAIQNQEKEKRAAELIVANQELAFQNEEKEKRAAELIVANRELAFQNEEKEKRAAELIVANAELAFQNEEKEKRAAELMIANSELVFQNNEKEKRAAELVVANKELAFQSKEKEKRAAELFNANKELELFLYISSHDLQEPLRKIQMSASRIDDKDYLSLSDKGRDHFVKMQQAASSMQTLIEDLLAYARTNAENRTFKNLDIKVIIDDVKVELKEFIEEKQAVITGPSNCQLHIIPFQFRHMMHNILTNSLKFSVPGQPPQIEIKCSCDYGLAYKHASLDQQREYCHISISDNGIGFEPVYNEKIFEVFQRLHGKEVYKGTGIGLAIVRKIVENHNGVITASGELGKGTTFDIYIPTLKNNA